MLDVPRGLEQFAYRLAAHTPLTSHEIGALLRLPHQFVLPLGEERVERLLSSEFCVLVVSGIVSQYRILSSGERQIVGFTLPGEVADLESLLGGSARPEEPESG